MGRAMVVVVVGSAAVFSSVVALDHRDRARRDIK